MPLVCHLCGAYLRRNSIARGDFVRLKAFPESGTFRVTGVYQLVAAESELGDRMWVTLRQGDTIAGRVEVSAVQKVRQT